MIKAVYDTNIIVSALIGRSFPFIALLLVLTDNIQLVVTESLFQEYEEVLRRPKFRNLHQYIPAVLSTIRRYATFVTPDDTIAKIIDEPDNRILECAVAGKVDYIVTENTKHFSFEEFMGIKVVSPREFINLIAPDILVLG
jgi:putative PIN family toxin of toxin-antitoxin system